METYLYSKEGKIMKKNNKGFTLVELIVVLVILAILAAILVPTLLGYIDRARSEKDYSTAQTVRVAAQAVIDQAYGNGVKTTASASTDAVTSISNMNGVLAKATPNYGTTVYTLSGVKETDVTDYTFTYSGGIITSGNVTINGHVYYLNNGAWQTTNPNP